MIKTILLNTTTRQIVSIVETIDSMYTAGQTYNDLLAVTSDGLPNVSDEELYTQWHYTNEWVKHSKSPNDDYVFDVTTLMWQEPEGYLEIKKAEHANTINRLASIKILDVYPIYRQLNIERESSEEAKTTMHTYIDAVRGFANVAKAGITATTSVSDMRTTYSTFITDLTTI
jgi:hypothetical protein